MKDIFWAIFEGLFVVFVPIVVVVSAFSLILAMLTFVGIVDKKYLFQLIGG